MSGVGHNIVGNGGMGMVINNQSNENFTGSQVNYGL